MLRKLRMVERNEGKNIIKGTNETCGTICGRRFTKAGRPIENRKAYKLKKIYTSYKLIVYIKMEHIACGF
jgi:hypothetical protein